jgi:proteic killer suppression protein
MILAALETSQRIEDMDIPGLKLHALKGKLKNRFAVSVSGNWRITFEFRESNVYVLDYEDYH